jgi:chromosome segregation ATPase
VSVDNLEIESLKSRYQTLSHKKTAVDTELKTAKKGLEDLQAKAKSEYGTSDIDELKEKLRAMRTENESKTREYKEHLDRIEEKLNDIERDAKVETEDSSDPFADD